MEVGQWEVPALTIEMRVEQPLTSIWQECVASLPFQHYPLAEAQRGLKQTHGQGLFNTAISMEWVPPTAEDEDALLDLEEIREQDDPTEVSSKSNRQDLPY